MKLPLSLVFTCISIISFSQTELRLEMARGRIKESKPFIPDSEVLENDQRALLRNRHAQKIKAETILLDKKYVLEDCYMTSLVDSVVKALLSANPEIPQHTEAFIYKSTAFNAFTMGEDILFINANLVYECRNVNELATVIAHEIAHNSLKHSQKDQIKTIKFLTNDSIQKELRIAARQEYGQATALNSLMLPKILNDKEQSRQNELDADSLGLKYVIAAGFDASLGIKVFEIMNYYSEALAGKMDFSALPTSVQEVFSAKEKYYSRENSLGFSKKIETEWDSYLASHPYSNDRYTALEKAYNLANVEMKRSTTEIRSKLYQEMSKIAFQLGELSRYQYMAVENYDLEAQNQTNTALGFIALGFLKERYIIGKYIESQNLAQPEDYDRFCHILTNCSSANFYAMSTTVVPKISFSTPGLTPEQQVIGIVGLIKADDKETLKLIWPQYVPELKDSPYGWFISELEEYLYSVKRYTFVKQIK